MDMERICMKKGGWHALGIVVGFVVLAVVVQAGGAGALSNDGGRRWNITAT